MNNNTTSEPANRRRCRRCPPKGATRATCLKGSFGLDKNLVHSVLDISEEGIRLLLTEALPVGQEVEITLENVNCSRPLKTLGTVVWTIPAVSGSCCVGVRFQRTLPYADLTVFIRT